MAAKIFDCSFMTADSGSSGFLSGSGQGFKFSEAGFASKSLWPGSKVPAIVSHGSGIKHFF